MNKSTKGKPMTTATYGNWGNYETWNVALWIQNDEGLYNFARRYDSYAKFVSAIGFGETTGDGVSYASTKLNYAALDEMMADL
jgi:hypothetical protein